jgi:rhodanese-related sulfurtransferase
MFTLLKNIFGKDSSGIEQALQQGAIIIDVRTPDEFREGHIEGSKNIPVTEIKQKLEMIRKWNKPVITVCLSGGRSTVAKSFLTSAGIEAHNGGSWSNLKKLKS